MNKEDNWISWLKKNVIVPKRVTRAIGEDCAVIKVNKRKSLLVTSDMLVEGVHFDMKKVMGRQIGYKAAAVSLSDIASMCGAPKWAVASISAPSSLGNGFLKQVFAGLQKALSGYGAFLIGGDSNGGDRFVIDVTLIGEVDNKDLARRDTAGNGDLILVTGKLGGSYESGRHLSFVPRVKEAAYLRKRFALTSMIDISDGLAQDLRRLCAESALGAEVYEEFIPRNNGCSVDKALYDGEDFELLFSIPAKDFSEKELLAFISRFGINLSVIGCFTNTKKGAYLIDNKGRKQKLLNKSYSHFG